MARSAPPTPTANQLSFAAVVTEIARRLVQLPGVAEVTTLDTSGTDCLLPATFLIAVNPATDLAALGQAVRRIVGSALIGFYLLPATWRLRLARLELRQALLAEFSDIPRLVWRKVPHAVGVTTPSRR